MLYDENTNYMNNKAFRSVHRVDFWSGYYSNKGQHKALIKQGFHKWMVTRNLYELASLTRCQDIVTSEIGHVADLLIANQKFYDSYCTEQARAQYDQKMAKLSKVIPVGAHHDTITGTSKELVHNDEKTKFTTAIAELEQMLANLYTDYFNLQVIGIADTSDAIAEMANFF